MWSTTLSMSICIPYLQAAGVRDSAERVEWRRRMQHMPPSTMQDHVRACSCVLLARRLQAGMSITYPISGTGLVLLIPF